MDAYNAYVQNTLPIKVIKCTRDDVGELDSISKEAFGPRSSNSQQIHTLLDLDKQIFWKIIRVNRGRLLKRSDKIDGYFAIIRITPEGKQAILKGSFQGNSPDPTHVRTDKKRYPDVYVAAVYGRSKRDRGHVLAGLSMHLEMIKAKAIYARAVTNDGLRLLRHYGFRPLAGQPDLVGSMFQYQRNTAAQPTR